MWHIVVNSLTTVSSVWHIVVNSLTTVSSVCGILWLPLMVSVASSHLHCLQTQRLMVVLSPLQLGVVIDLKEKVARSSLASPSAVGCELCRFERQYGSYVIFFLSFFFLSFFFFFIFFISFFFLFFLHLRSYVNSLV